MMVVTGNRGNRNGIGISHEESKFPTDIIFCGFKDGGNSTIIQLWGKTKVKHRVGQLPVHPTRLSWLKLENYPEYCNFDKCEKDKS